MPPGHWSTEFGDKPGTTALTTTFIGSQRQQGVFIAKPNQSGSLNYKEHIWFFYTVYNYALKLGVRGCSKGNLQTKPGAGAITQVQPSTTSPCFSFHHVHSLNYSSLPWTSVHSTEDSGWNKGRGGADFSHQKTLSKQTGKKCKKSIGQAQFGFPSSK